MLFREKHIIFTFIFMQDFFDEQIMWLLRAKNPPPPPFLKYFQNPLAVLRIWYYLAANNKGADQTARMRRLICAFVVGIGQIQVFSWRGSYSGWHNSILPRQINCAGRKPPAKVPETQGNKRYLQTDGQTNKKNIGLNKMTVQNKNKMKIVTCLLVLELWHFLP